MGWEAYPNAMHQTHHAVDMTALDRFGYTGDSQDIIREGNGKLCLVFFIVKYMFFKKQKKRILECYGLKSSMYYIIVG